MVVREKRSSLTDRTFSRSLTPIASIRVVRPRQTVETAVNPISIHHMGTTNHCSRHFAKGHRACAPHSSMGLLYLLTFGTISCAIPSHKPAHNYCTHHPRSHLCVVTCNCDCSSCRCAFCSTGCELLAEKRSKQCNRFA